MTQSSDGRREVTITVIYNSAHTIELLLDKKIVTVFVTLSLMEVDVRGDTSDSDFCHNFG